MKKCAKIQAKICSVKICKFLAEKLKVGSKEKELNLLRQNTQISSHLLPSTCAQFANIFHAKFVLINQRLDDSKVQAVADGCFSAADFPLRRISHIFLLEVIKQRRFLPFFTSSPFA
jgi:hypothetical protein